MYISRFIDEWMSRVRADNSEKTGHFAGIKVFHWIALIERSIKSYSPTSTSEGPNCSKITLQPFVPGICPFAL